MVKMGTVWDRTTEFLGDNLAALMPIALLTIFLPTSVQQNVSEMVKTAGPGLKIGLGACVVALSLFAFWGQLAITAMALNLSSESRSATTIATRRLIPAFITFAIALFLLSLLMLPLVAILGAEGFDFTAAASGGNPTVPEGAKLPLGLAFLVLLPVGLWLGARIAVITKAVVVAEDRWLSAIARSFKLTRGLALRIIGVMILYGIVLMVASLAAESVFGSIFELVAGGDGPLSLAKILTSIVVGAVETIFSVLATVFCAKLYLATSGQEDTTLT